MHVHLFSLMKNILTFYFAVSVAGTCNDIDDTWFTNIVAVGQDFNFGHNSNSEISAHVSTSDSCWDCLFVLIQAIYNDSGNKANCVSPLQFSRACLSAFDSEIRTTNTCMSTISGAVSVDIVTGAETYTFADFQNV